LGVKKQSKKPAPSPWFDCIFQNPGLIDATS
jgi:hypothetical protein